MLIDRRTEGKWRRVAYCAVVSIMTAVLPAVVHADSLDAGRLRRPLNGWISSLGAGALNHAEWMSPGPGGGIDLALAASVGRRIGNKADVEIAGLVSTPSDNIGARSLGLMRARLRVYPAGGRAQRDQIYLQFGVGFALAKGWWGGTRKGGGPEIALGLDYAIGRDMPLFLECGFALVSLTEGHPRPRAGHPLPDMPSEGMGIGVFHLMCGARFGL